MVYPEVSLLFKSNAICEHNFKLSSEATLCWCHSENMLSRFLALQMTRLLFLFLAFQN